jgi:hypothetical protein
LSPRLAIMAKGPKELNSIVVGNKKFGNTLNMDM